MRSSSAKSNLRALMLIPSEIIDCIKSQGWRKLTFKAVIELIAPQTWSASVMPVVLASVLSIAITGTFSSLLFFSLLLASICLQCAVNALNDYSDFATGVDQKENCDDPTDASILYNDYDPVLAFVIGCLFIAAGLAFGLYAIVTVGPMLILFGFIGVVIIFLYSYGLLPLSYTPLGEFTSGFLMGGIITFACFYAFSGRMSAMAAVYSIPLIITIGLIMLTNNGCDIERDLASSRRTLPGRIGRQNTLMLHIVLFALAAVLAAVVVLVRFSGGFCMLPLFAAMTIPAECNLIKTGLEPSKRMHAMAAATLLNVRLSGMYALMIVFDRLELFNTPITAWFLFC